MNPAKCYKDLVASLCVIFRFAVCWQGRKACLIFLCLFVRPIHSQLNWAALLCDVTPDGKTEQTAQFWQEIAQASELSFPVFFHTENCAVHSGNPTVSSFYLPTSRWHHLKALNSFSRWTSRDVFLFKYHFLLHILRFLFFFSDNIMADVGSKQQTTALFLSTIVTRTRRHTELTIMMRNLCCAREHSLRFFVQFFTQLKCAVQLKVYWALYRQTSLAAPEILFSPVFWTQNTINYVRSNCEIFFAIRIHFSNIS